MINRKWNVRGYCSSKVKVSWKQKQKRTEKNKCKKKYINAFIVVTLDPSRNIVKSERKIRKAKNKVEISQEIAFIIE